MPRYTYNGVTVTATRRRPSTRDDKKYMRTVTVDGGERLVHYGDPNLPMRRNNDDARENFVARHNCSEKRDPTAPGFWACYDWENTREMSDAQEFIFFELADDALIDGRPFAGFAVGEFVDMHGREVEFTIDTLGEFVKNTIAAIEAAVAKKMPGLPIDARQHDKGDAAGWITGAELGEVEDSAGSKVPVIKFLAKWTKLGASLIKDKIQTNFSPTVDLKNKVIRGGSLTNWPASMDASGAPLFEAVELAQGVHYMRQVDELTSAGDDRQENKPEEIDMSKNDKTAVQEPLLADDKQPAAPVITAELKEQIRQEVIAELAAPTKGESSEEAMKRLRQSLNVEAFADVADLTQARDAMLGQMQNALKAEYDRMQRQAGNMLADMMQQIKRDQHIADLSQKWTGGTEQRPHALPVGREEMETFLLSLDDKQRAAAESIIGRIWENGLTEFAEYGHGRRQRGTAQLEPEIARQLKTHVDNGGSIEAFFNAAGPLLGDMEQYDLSKFEGDK